MLRLTSVIVTDTHLCSPTRFYLRIQLTIMWYSLNYGNNGMFKLNKKIHAGSGQETGNQFGVAYTYVTVVDIHTAFHKLFKYFKKDQFEQQALGKNHRR